MPRTVVPARPNQPAPSRLPVALGAATLVVAALLQVLAVLLQPGACPAPLCNGQETELAVTIEEQPSAPRQDPAPIPEPTDPPAAETVAETAREAAVAGMQELLPDDPSARDWKVIAAKASRQHVVDHFRKERAQASRWEKSRSVMFEPSADVVGAAGVQPLMADLHFRAPVGVLGLGLTLGSCFVGLPLLGVPLEKRSVSGLTLVVCATESL